jgi:hypothetical protein
LNERAILAPKKYACQYYQLSHPKKKLPGAITSYKSVDSALNKDDAVNYPAEFLNSLELPGM